MTSISAASINTHQSPLQMLQNELLSEVKSGAISSSDQDALSAVLTDIDSAVQASRASDQASGTRPSPDAPSDTASSSDDTSSTSATSVEDILKQFLELLKESQSSSYGAPGTASSTASLSALLIDYQS